MSTSTQKWSLSFGQVEALIGIMSGVKASRVSQLRFRLKNLFKVGFLPHAAAGRGKAARYGPGEVLQLALAVELMHFDLGPHRIFDLMNRLDDMIPKVAFAGGSQLADPEKHLTKIYLSFEPIGLESLSRDYGEELDLKAFIYQIDRPAAVSNARHIATINVTRLITDIAAALESTNLCATREFAQILMEWGEQRFGVPSSDLDS
jgi:hypothetical protein